ncbi:hypothetical protein D6792_01050, partial [Candidatus Parcubacteria bacterium]
MAFLSFISQQRRHKTVRASNASQSFFWDAWASSTGALSKAPVLLAVVIGVSVFAPSTALGAEKPSCPFEPAPSRTIVTFQNYTLVASRGPTQETQPVTLPAGRYTISYYSYDGYEGREKTDPNTQNKEQWNMLLIDSSGKTITTFGPTPDLKDGVPFAEQKGVFVNDVLVNQDIAKVMVQHVLHPADPQKNPNSVSVGCVVFDRVSTDLPRCPLTEGVVVKFPSVWLRSDLGADKARTASVKADLEAGKYEVRVVAFDNHSDKPNQVQPREQIAAIVAVNGKEVARTPATPDIPDDGNIASGSWTITIPNNTNEVWAQHAAYPDTTSPNSVVPICAAFKKLPEPKQPSCTL